MNTELAMRTLEVAKASPENFNMESFFSDLPDEGITKAAPGMPPLCGTTACYAGFTALLHAPEGTKVGWRDDEGPYVFIPGQESVHVETYAIKALDITEEQANILFYLESIDQVERVVRHLASNPSADGGALRDAAAVANA